MKREARKKIQLQGGVAHVFFSFHRISDELLSELTEEVINEIDEALNSCAQTLFDSEFHKPS